MKAIVENRILLEYSEEKIEILQKYNINYGNNYYDTIEISEQKITLDEKSMNHLFSEIFLNNDIEYAWLGGEGCDFSLRIK